MVERPEASKGAMNIWEGLQLYYGEERDGGENDKGERPGVGYGKDGTCKASVWY